MLMMLPNGGSVDVAMSSGNKPQRFKMSLPFLLKKKKRQNLLRNNSVVDHIDNDVLETCVVDSGEENEEQHNDIYSGRAVVSVDEEGIRKNSSASRAEDNDDENLTRALVPKYLGPTNQLQNIKTPLTYKTYDVQFSPSISSHSSRRKSKTGSPRGLDINPSISGPLPAPNKTTGVGCKSWMKTKCISGNCSKQAGHGKGDQRERQGHGDRVGHSKRHSFRAKFIDQTAWERVSQRSVLAEVENDIVKQKRTARENRVHKDLAPSPDISSSVRVTITPEAKCSLRDSYKEVRETGKYSSPALQHITASEVNCSPLLTDMEVNSAEELRIYPCGRSFSSPSSDDELFTTSVETEGKQRKKKWTSNSSDDTECRQQRSSGSYSRSKSTWSRDSIMTVAEVEEEQQEAYAGETLKSRSKKGSKIIFLSTPPRPKQLGPNEADEQATPGFIVKCATDGYGDYSRLKSLLKEKGSIFDKAFNTSYKSNPPPSLFGGVLEGNAKAWSKRDVRRIKEGVANETGIGEPAMIPRTKETRLIDMHIEDQISNLRLDSDDESDSSPEKSYSSRGSRRKAKAQQLPSSKFLDQERPWKKKRSSASSRRRKGRTRSKVPLALLPDDLHGRVKESVAVVKSSYNPYNDFRDSMMEMILQKEIQGAGDLEELLRCYLSLNSAEYHSVIVKVFADVWRELFADKEENEACKG
ncbi:hypothetical protein R1flu_009742 [Riccia fluitans]|uniref:OVATE domain-containing protein n=1 Tax=Riccia fluitans TaxID=41844 RepID=A0ABD1Z3R7_9MARC